jgi:hypothetical protein
LIEHQKELSVYKRVNRRPEILVIKF